MTEPIISKDFTMEDIRRLRDYSSERHSTMTHEEILNDIRYDADKMLALIARRKAQKALRND